MCRVLLIFATVSQQLSCRYRLYRYRKMHQPWQAGDILCGLLHGTDQHELSRMKGRRPTVGGGSSVDADEVLLAACSVRWAALDNAQRL